VSRDYAAIRPRIWSDVTFASQNPDAILLFLFLWTQSDLSYAGSIHMRLRQWARKLPGLGEDRVRAAVDVLAANGYVVVDDVTEELLIRSFVAEDELWKQPKMLALSVKQARTIESEHLRAAYGRELLRLDAARVAPNIVMAGYELSGQQPPAARPDLVPDVLAGGGSGGRDGVVEGVGEPPGAGAGAGAPPPASPQTPRKRGAVDPPPSTASCHRHRRPRSGCAECRRAQELAAVPPKCDECGPNRMRENERGQPYRCPACHPGAQAPQLRVVGGDG